MRRTTTGRARARLVLFGIPCVFGAGCDLGTKALAEEALTDLPGRTMSVIAPWLDFSLSYNQGTAFSFVEDLGAIRWFVGLLSLVVVAVMLAIALRRQTSRREGMALGIVAGGAVGNGLDRMFRQLPDGTTAVVDFIRVNYPWGGSWPTFNVADVLVAIGVVSLSWVCARRPPDQEAVPE